MGSLCLYQFGYFGQYYEHELQECRGLIHDCVMGHFSVVSYQCVSLMTLACSRPLFLAFPCVFEALYVNGFTCDFCTLVACRVKL